MGHVVAGTRHRGGRAVQSWVKPEVDTPMGKRLRRRICLLVLFVCIRAIRGSRTSEQNRRGAQVASPCVATTKTDS
jgi:hypothetical protein